MQIDRFTVALGFADGRARNQSPQIAPVHVTRSVVVRIEEIRVFRNFGTVFRQEFFEDKCFEKPGGMRQMPLGGADVGHGLHDAIFRFKVRAQRIGKIPSLMKTIAQPFDATRLRRRNTVFRHHPAGGDLGCARAQGFSPSCSSSSRRASSI